MNKDEHDLIDEMLDSAMKGKIRDTKGQDKSKTYHKITISIDELQKNKIKKYAKKHFRGNISELIKSLLEDKKII